MDKNKELARTLYAEQGLDALDITRYIDEDLLTIEGWIRDDEWMKLRTAKNLSPKNLIQLYYEQSEAIMKEASAEQRSLTLKETNTLAKLADCINKIERRMDSGAVMNMLEAFNNYLVRIKPQLARELVIYEMEYVRTLIKAGK
jgi:uncharacterized protein (DUF885 family)